MKKRNQFLPFCQAEFDDSEIDEVVQSMRSGWLTMGKKVQQFETQFAKYIGCKFALSVNSCTAALELALLAHGIGPGDEVLVPSFTFVSTVNVILHVGATPIFVDISADNLTLDPADLEAKFTKKSKAVVVVHYAGTAADMTAISSFAKKHHLTIIEDAAHAVGTKFKNRQIGALGYSTCFSFYATKTMTTGEGGMLTTNSARVANYVMRNRLHGISKDAWKRYMKGGSWKYDVISPGMKCNMTDIQASMGIHQLNKLESFISRRKKIIESYQVGFKDNPYVHTFYTPKTVRHSHHLFPILVSGMSRDEFIEKMTEYNIGVSVHFIPVHSFSFYKKQYPKAGKHLPVTNKIFKQIVSLPLYPSLSEADVSYVIHTVNLLTNKSK